MRKISLVLMLVVMLMSVSCFAENVWDVHYYVDDFGDATTQKYMTNTPVIGNFSNCATQNSKLAVRFLVDIPDCSDTSTPAICIKLYEYGRSLVTGTDTYALDIKYSVGDESWKVTNMYSYKAVLRGDRLVINDTSNIHFLLKAHKYLKFSIINTSTPISPPSTYRFTIDATGYTATYNKLK